MTSYLHLQCGPYQFLLPSTQVLAIEDLAEASEPTGKPHRSWRGRRLPVLDLCTRLGISHPSKQQQLIIGEHFDDQNACILEAGQVQQLTTLDEQDFIPLAAVNPAMHALVDAAWLPPARDNRPGALRLRLPLQHDDLQHDNKETLS